MKITRKELNEYQNYNGLSAITWSIYDKNYEVDYNDDDSWNNQPLDLSTNAPDGVYSLEVYNEIVRPNDERTRVEVPGIVVEHGHFVVDPTFATIEEGIRMYLGYNYIRGSFDHRFVEEMEYDHDKKLFKVWLGS